MNLPLAPAFAFLLVVVRLAGLLMVAPGWGARVVPARVRLAASLVLGWVIFVGARMPMGEAPTTLFGLVGAVASETLIGLCGGLAARMVTEAALAAGQTAALSMGLGFGALLDPASGAESTTIGQMLSMLTLASAMALGIHREAIVWLAASLQRIPPGGAVEMTTLAQAIIEQAILSIALAVRVAYPILAAITLGYAALGLLGRAAPQLNISSVGFSISILAGGGALFWVAPAAAQLCAETARAAFGVH